MITDIANLTASQEAYINWALRECLIFWGSQCLTSADGEFDPGHLPTRFSGGIKFGKLVVQYGRAKSFIAKKNHTLLSKGWKSATAQMKKG